MKLRLIAGCRPVGNDAEKFEIHFRQTFSFSEQSLHFKDSLDFYRHRSRCRGILDMVWPDIAQTVQNLVTHAEQAYRTAAKAKRRRKCAYLSCCFRRADGFP